MNDIIAVISGLPYWAWALGVSAAFYGGILKGCNHLKDDATAHLSLYLQGDYDGTWAQQFGAVFDLVFGEKAFSTRRICMSILASLTAVFLLYLLVDPVLNATRRVTDDMSVWRILLIGAIVNTLPDWISLWETRLVLRLFEHVRNSVIQFVVLIADAAMSGIIIYVGIQGFRWITGQAQLAPVEMLALFSIYAIFFYSTFVTSVAAWLFWISSAFVRLIGRLGFGHILDLQKSPGKSLALIAGLVIFAALMAVKPLVTLGADGRVAADDFLCAQFPTTACRHVARLTADEEEKLAYLSRICTDEITWQCLSVGFDIARINPKEAAALWRKICEGGDARGCTNLAHLHNNGLGFPRDRKNAERLFARACDGGDLRGCVSLGGLAIHSDAAQKDYYKARILFAKACDGGTARGCTGLGHLYSSPSGILADYPRARDYYVQGCEGGDPQGCSNLGWYYSAGPVTDRDLDKSTEFYTRGCDGGDPNGCSNLGWIHLQEKTPESLDIARDLLTQGCDREDFHGCSGLGLIYADGLGVPPNLAKALRYFSRGCDGNSPMGCVGLGILYDEARGVVEDHEKARMLYKKGCDAGLSRGCARLGALHARGLGGARDFDIARDLFEQSCAEKDRLGCLSLGVLYEIGQGVTQNFQRAKEHFRQACLMGNQAGCAKLDTFPYGDN